MENKIRNKIDGMIILDKPKDFTSNDCLAVIKKTLHPYKLGHTGTLDTNATGVLVCLLGKSTKCQDYLMSYGKKVYEAELIIGISTDTEDILGNIVDESIDFNIDIENVKNALKSFVGDYMQIPPMYSAKKVDGKKLINLARKGKEIERKACNIKIYDIETLSDLSYKEIKEHKVLSLNIKVTCSKGTYIRTLCKDIGIKLGIPSCMGELRRLSSGDFNINDSIKLSDLENKVKNGDLSFIKPCMYMSENSVVTFGKFETLHIGHQKIISEVVRIAREKGLKSTVLIVGKNDDNEIITKDQRISKLKYLGVDNIVEFELNDYNIKIEPRAFIEDILLNQLKAKVVVVGSDCSFGAKAAGDKDLLYTILKEHDAEAIIIDKLKIENTNIDVSSTYIRSLFKDDKSSIEKLLNK